MSKDELNAYYRHLDNIVILKDNIFTEREEGRAEGRAEGREEGRKEGRAEGRAKGRAEGEKKKNMENAIKMKRLGLGTEIINKVTGLSPSEIDELQS